MADLWERLTDKGLDAVAPGDEPIPIHTFWGMVQEWEEGYETQANVLSAFNIQPGIQTTQATTIKQHINAAPDTARFIRMAKNWSYCAETIASVEGDKYRDFAQFTTRMANEVTDQGGTPP